MPKILMRIIHDDVRQSRADQHTDHEVSKQPVETGYVDWAEMPNDPSLHEVSPKGRAVLERVERERAYSRFRLDLLDEI